MTEEEAKKIVDNPDEYDDRDFRWMVHEATGFLAGLEAGREEAREIMSDAKCELECADHRAFELLEQIASFLERTATGEGRKEP